VRKKAQNTKKNKLSASSDLSKESRVLLHLGVVKKLNTKQKSSIILFMRNQEAVNNPLLYFWAY
jgi:hypothetical protein